MGGVWKWVPLPRFKRNFPSFWWLSAGNTDFASVLVPVSAENAKQSNGRSKLYMRRSEFFCYRILQESRSGLRLSALCTSMFCHFLWVRMVCFCTVVQGGRKHHSTLIALPLTPAIRKKILWNRIRACQNEIKFVMFLFFFSHVSFTLAISQLNSEDPILVYSMSHLQLLAWEITI